MTMRRPSACALALIALSSASASADAAAGLSIHVLSNRADLISGGDALVRLEGAGAASARVDLNGRDITGAFARRPNGHVEALVTGLRDGANVVTARKRGGAGARLKITGHPIGGPVFAGPQVKPWICNTERYKLGKPRDAQCNVAPNISYQYKDALTGQMHSYHPTRAPRDSQIATTKTDQGHTVPYIVRIERGVIDRGIYQLRVLGDPNRPWSALDPRQQPGWNRKVYWIFGGDCTPSHLQADATGGALPSVTTAPVDVVGRGFLIGQSANTNLGTNCNSVVSAETLMMLKEHINEMYGPIRYTMSEGCSGGAMLQNWITSDYPGLLDGIMPSCSYPDIWETMQEAEDCHLLDRVFDADPVTWTLEKRAAVTGYPLETVCRSLWDTPGVEIPGVVTTPQANGYSRYWLDPDHASGCQGGALGGDVIAQTTQPRPAWIYDAKTNRAGVRCTLPDYMVAIFGRRPSDNFANRPFDNVGVQYGLHALLSGVISPAQFVALNERVGGLDIDWNNVARRSAADPAALNVAYRAGLVASLREQRSVPVITLRGADNLEIHTDFHDHVLRARLDKANGHHDNQIIWTGLAPIMSDPAASTNAVWLLDRWLTAIENDDHAGTLEEKVRRNKPRDAVDACWVVGRRITDSGICRTVFPYFSDPRIAAGGPGTDDVLKCQLRPLDRGEYAGVTFSDAQWARLTAAFPGGVCDYRKPSVGAQPSLPWMTFESGPGGAPLGHAPRSTALRPVCKSKRHFRVRMTLPRGARVMSSSARLGTKELKVKRRGRVLVTDVPMNGLPRKMIRLVFRVRLRGGRVLKTSRTYHPCQPRR